MLENTTRVCYALKTIPLIGLTVLLVWVEYASWISIGVIHMLVEQGNWLAFLVHSLLHYVFWGLTVWSLVVTVNRGPGFVEKGTRREQDIGLQSATPPAVPLRPRRHSDTDPGDPDRPDDRVPLLSAEQPMPLQSLVQRAAEMAGFDAKEVAHPHGIELPEDMLMTAKADGTVRFCRKCQSVKPDRAHHCSVCNQCVLMMDHHCPWISTCVGHRNRKAFVLFLTYATFLSYYSGARGLVSLLAYTESHSVNYEYAPLSWAFLLLLGFVFGIVLTGFSGYHWWLICHNRTTLENMESSNRVRFTSKAEEAGERYRSDYALSRVERKRLSRAAATLNIFDLGTRENVAMIFGPPRNGTSPFGQMSWFLPSGPVPGDGRTWPINERHREELERISRQVRRMDSASSSTSPSGPSSCRSASTPGLQSEVSVT